MKVTYWREHSQETVALAVEALVRFKREFNRDLTPSVLAEVYVARELGLTPVELCNHPGYDCSAMTASDTR